MKTLRTLVAGLAVALVASPVAAQDVSPVTLTAGGAVSYNGTTVGPYQARFGSDPGAPSVDVFCIDYVHQIQVGQTFNANLTNLASGNLSLTRGGDAALAQYQQMAWLTTKFDGATNDQTRAIQTAIWHVMTPGTPGAIGGAFGTQYWLDQAASNYLTSGLDYSTFAIITDVNFMQGGRQELLTRVPTTVTPEPGTYLLMATGLAGVGMIARRRKATAAV